MRFFVYIAYRISDEDWTKEETDYLFDLIREYDVRFYVVADRYDYPGGKPRSTDVCISHKYHHKAVSHDAQDIKDRYCSVCRRLIRNRPWAGDENSKTQLLSSYTFDKGLTATLYLACIDLFSQNEKLPEKNTLRVSRAVHRSKSLKRRLCTSR